MRSYAIILIMLLSLAADPAMSADILMGTVVSVEQKSGQVVLRVVNNSDETAEKGKDDDMMEEIILQIASDRLLGAVSVGKVVRVWGNYVQGEIGKFQVSHISQGHSPGRKSDPTGVRQRLKKVRGRFGKGRHRGQRSHR